MAKQGKWILSEVTGLHEYMECSCCGNSEECEGGFYPYCPNCGAKMDLELKENESSE